MSGLVRVQNLSDRAEAIGFLESRTQVGELAYTESGIKNELLQALASLGSSVQVPEPIWVAVRGDDGALLGVLHAAAPLDYALEQAATEPLHLVASYVSEHLMIEELVVDQAVRRQGIATALLTRAHKRARASTDDPHGFTVTAATPSPESDQFFRSNGYVVGADPEARLDKMHPGDGWAVAWLCDLIDAGSPHLERR